MYCRCNRATPSIRIWNEPLGQMYMCLVCDGIIVRHFDVTPPKTL